MCVYVGTPPTISLGPACFLRTLAPSCKSKQGNMHDGGCQPANQCGLCCETQCKLSRKFDKQCVWTGKECVRCYQSGPVDNGGPVFGSPVVLPNWETDGAGDLVQIVPACKRRYVTGIQLYMTETDKSATTPPVVSSRLIVFQHNTGIVVVDWTGSCQLSPISWLSHSYTVSCDFKDGSMRIPAGMYPELAPDWYDVLWAQLTSPTLGWMATQPPTGCTFQNECAFTQDMSPSAALPRIDLCISGGVAYRNLAFQLLGTNSINGRPLPAT